MNKIKFDIVQDNFNQLVDILSDLTKIGDTIKIKIINEEMMLYSILGDNIIIAFKNYNLKTKDFFRSKEEDINLDIVISNCKKFVKNLNFIKASDKITFDVAFKKSNNDDSVMVGRSLTLTGGKLKINWLASEQFTIKNITRSNLDKLLNINNSKWSFDINKNDYSDIKKLSTINDDKLLNIETKNGKVIISENSAWELEIDNTIEDTINSSLILNKRFLGCIDDSNDIKFNIFDNFILINTDNSNLMLSFEQNFEED